MSFPSIPFAYFFLVVLTVSWWIRHHRMAQKGFLLGVSYLFYAGWRWTILVILVLSSLVNWWLGERIQRQSQRHRQKLWLVLGICANLGVLGFFKYYDFFRASFGELSAFFGLSLYMPVFEVLLPLGISFYTFQSIAYLVDLYRGKAVLAESLLDYLLFVGFFPQLVAGPICRSHDLLPQFHEPALDKIPEFSRAVTLILSGLFKKVVLATFLSTHLVQDAFVAPENYTSMALWLTVYAYSVQIYLDFSGYTDLARGLGLLLGFRLPKNFNYPYAATNIGEFWRRWHMTFSKWLREYIYFPLGGSRCARWLCYRNLMITFVLCGLWHGPAWGYVIWGTVHGIGMVLYKASLDLRRDRGIDPKSRHPWWWMVLGWAATLSFCALARIFFCTADLATAGRFWWKLLAFSGTGTGAEWLVWVVMFFGLGLHFYGRLLFERFVSMHRQCPPLLRPVLWLSAAVLLFALKPAGIAPYIYFQF